MFEVVYTYSDWYDGPRGGIADFKGVPHLNQCEWEERHGYTDIFRLVPVDAYTLRLALEDWAIWLRWETAFRQGQVGVDTHPALPAERATHEQLEELLKARLIMPPEGALRKVGLFRSRNDQTPDRDGSMEVEWTDPD